MVCLILRDVVVASCYLRCYFGLQHSLVAQVVRTDNSFHLSYARGLIKTDTDKRFFEVAPGGVSGCGGFSGHPYSVVVAVVGMSRLIF